MSAFIKGHELLAGGLDIINALNHDAKQINNQTNVSIAETSQLGWTHYGRDTFTDAPSVKTTFDGNDIFVFTMRGMGDTSERFQFLLTDGCGGRIWFRCGWDSWQPWKKIYDEGA